MTLTIHTEEDAQRQARLTVEVAEERLEKAIGDKIRQLARDTHIPGFRKGKAPPQVLARRVGENALRAEVIDELLPAILQEALAQANLAPYSTPQLDDLEVKPLVIKLTIPLEPQIKLGDYRAIRKEITAVNIADEAVAEALEQIRLQHQVLEPVERPAETGDVVTLQGQGYVIGEDGEVESSGEPFFDEERLDVLADAEKLLPGTGFVENITGMAAGESKEFHVTFPEDYDDANLAGKEAKFNVSILDVKLRELPELDDELAKIEGEYETLDELRQAVREQLQKEAEQQARSKLVDDMIDELLSDAEIVYPPAAVEHEIDRMITAFKERLTASGWKWEQYLQLQNETEEEVREHWREEATNQLRRSLVFGEFVRQEKVQVGQADVNEALAQRLDKFDDEAVREHMQTLFSSERGLQMLSGDILFDKVQERIEAIVSGNAPDLDALPVAEVAEEEE